MQAFRDFQDTLYVAGFCFFVFFSKWRHVVLHEMKLHGLRRRVRFRPMKVECQFTRIIRAKMYTGYPSRPTYAPTSLPNNPTYQNRQDSHLSPFFLSLPCPPLTPLLDPLTVTYVLPKISYHYHSMQLKQIKVIWLVGIFHDDFWLVMNILLLDIKAASFGLRLWSSKTMVNSSQKKTFHTIIRFCYLSY